MIKNPLALVGLTLSMSANAAIYTVGGNDYGIEVVEGWYYEYTDRIEATPWFGNSTLSRAVSTVVGYDFGFERIFYSYQFVGPAFVYSLDIDAKQTSAYMYDSLTMVNMHMTYDDQQPAFSQNFAVISQVPIPAAAWLFGSALIVFAGLKRKK